LTTIRFGHSAVGYLSRTVLECPFPALFRRGGGQRRRLIIGDDRK
jgi:hypothetical protein